MNKFKSFVIKGTIASALLLTLPSSAFASAISTIYVCANPNAPASVCSNIYCEIPCY